MTFKLQCIQAAESKGGRPWRHGDNGDNAPDENKGSAPVATATCATTATNGAADSESVAPVAVVAVAPPPGIARCSACAHFEARPGETPDGRCTRHKVETWVAPLFDCPTYRPADLALVGLARRRHAVAADLKAHPALRYAFDVVNATPSGPAQADVSVMLGLRTTDNAIVAGELHIPADRWPGVGAFTQYWREAAEARLP
jgi:hypothetical protein